MSTRLLLLALWPVLFSQPVSSFMISLASRPTQAPWPTTSSISYLDPIICCCFHLHILCHPTIPLYTLPNSTLEFPSTDCSRKSKLCWVCFPYICFFKPQLDYYYSSTIFLKFLCRHTFKFSPPFIFSFLKFLLLCLLLFKDNLHSILLRIFILFADTHFHNFRYHFITNLCCIFTQVST